jgi:hypothetical protein
MGLVRKPHQKRLHWRAMHRCEDNIKVDLQEIRCKLGTRMNCLRPESIGKPL